MNSIMQSSESHVSQARNFLYSTGKSLASNLSLLKIIAVSPGLFGMGLLVTGHLSWTDANDPTLELNKRWTMQWTAMTTLFVCSAIASLRLRDLAHEGGQTPNYLKDLEPKRVVKIDSNYIVNAQERAATQSQQFTNI